MSDAEGHGLQDTGQRETTLRARYVFPIDRPPIADGAVTFSVPHPPAAQPSGSPLPAVGEGLGVRGSVILAVGSWSGLKSRHSAHVVDLGNAAILPGLVNAHTHLEFSDLPAPLGQAGMRFPDWIRAVVRYRRGRTQPQMQAAIRKGFDEACRAGTTALGEIATPGCPVDLICDEAVRANRPGTTVFLELLGLSAERAAANAVAAEEHLKRPGFIGLSPHAPYSVRPETVREAAALSRSANIPLAMHLAESPEEIELLESGRGPLYDLLCEFGVWDSTAIPPSARPIDYLRMLAGAHRTLVIHGTYLDDSEIAFLAAHADRMTVVYCPRTHAYFPHAPYPLAKLLAAGVTMALGTDSRASNPDLNLFEEIRFAAARHTVAPKKLLEIATLGGAKALGREHEFGSLAPGRTADLAVVRLPGIEADPYELLFDERSAVIRTIKAGNW